LAVQLPKAARFNYRRDESLENIGPFHQPTTNQPLDLRQPDAHLRFNSFQLNDIAIKSILNEL
jgi:hypothetical protein